MLFYRLYAFHVAQPSVLVPAIRDAVDMPIGEVQGRIHDLPTVKEVIERIMEEAERIIRKMPEKYLV